ncbi:MAG: xanthine dehydrogenase family protein subunit M, partial [Microcoleus sp. SIO2G3]|nr:xanthine dehydrogenase family protein subunit M [Microcoleus sp. SIO2G3]
MKPFSYIRAETANAAVQEVADNARAKFIGGGTNLLDLMKDGIEQPDRLVDIN